MSEIALSSFQADASDDSGEGAYGHDNEDDTEPAAAYAPPEVYRTPTEGTVTDFTFDSDDDNISFDYASPTPSHTCDSMDEDSFYTFVGDELDMLKSPGQSVDAPIDLRVSASTIDLTHSTDDDAKVSQGQVSSGGTLFTDTSDDDPKIV